MTANSFAQSTNISIGSTVIQPAVKRLGINLGGFTNYDSGQILKNLTTSNPGFNPSMWHSAIQCGAGSSTSCVDANHYSGFYSGFWTPYATQVQVISGAAAGCTTTLAGYVGGVSGLSGGTYTFNNSCGASIAPGDYIFVEKTTATGTYSANATNNYPAWGYIQNVTGGGTLSLQTSDLPPGNSTQALVMTAPQASDGAMISAEFDNNANGKSFVNLNGTYQISFWAKGVNGTQQVVVSFNRSGVNYLSPTTVTLTNSWTNYTLNFTASENGYQPNSAHLAFSTKGADTVYLDNISTTQLNGRADNPTVFRDEVVSTLQTLQPGLIRMWDGVGLGNTLDNMLVDQFGRMPTNFSGYSLNAPGYWNPITYSIPDFLQLVHTVSGSTEAWITLPITMTPQEASNLIDYLSGSASTVYGAKRIAQGFTAPWTSVIPKIHLEFGNESWNDTFYGGAIESDGVYGARAQTIFAAMKSNSYFDFSHTSLVLDAQFINGAQLQDVQNNCNNNDEIDVAPYMMGQPTDASSTAAIWGPALTEPQAFYAGAGSGVCAEYVSGSICPSAGYFNVNGSPKTVLGGGMNLDLIAEANSNHPVPVAIYEENFSTVGGSYSQAQLNAYSSAWGAGLATINEELLGIQNGVIAQNLFSLTQYNFKRDDGSSVVLWGSVIDMGGPTNLRRPQFLAQQVANSAIAPGAAMLQTSQTGTPTYTQSLLNTVAMINSNLVQSFAFSNGSGSFGLILLNTGVTGSQNVTLSGPNAPPNGVTITQTVLTSANLSDTNESSSLVAPVTTNINNFNPANTLTLAPFSETVLTWSTGATSTNAPVISNVSVSAITGNSAVISWTTDQASSSQVQFGVTGAYGSFSALNSSLATTHSVMLTGLTAGTNYNFAAMSSNSAGNSTTSANFTFATQSQAPVISAVNVTGITANSAVITWTTNQAASGQVQYGTSSSYGSSSSLNSSLTLTHTVQLTGLTSGVTYNYSAISLNAAGLSATSGNLSFSTPSTAPVISGVTVLSITGNSAVITWLTDQSSSSLVQYGTTVAYGSSSTLNASLLLLHSVKLTGLTPGVNYNFAAVSVNAAGTSATSANFSFTTTAVAPVISAVNVSGVTTGTATINWTTDQPSSSQVQYGTSATNGYMSGLNSTLTTAHSVSLNGLVGGTTYNFTAISVNSAGTSATSTTFTFTTTSPTPVISQVTISGITASSAVINWTTDQPTSSLAQYGTAGSYGSSSGVNSALVTNHSVTLTGLNNGTTYNFLVVSANSAGTSATSSAFTFTTLVKAPALSNIAVSGITSNSATITWTSNQASSSQVLYGTSSVYDSSSSVNYSLATTHSVTLAGLAAGATYNFAVLSVNSVGMSSTSTNFTFTTSAQAPVISNVTAGNLSTSSATIAWNTDQASSSLVQYGSANPNASAVTPNTTLVTAHAVTLSGLAAGTTYTYNVVSTNSLGLSTTSASFTFSTTPAPVASNGPAPQISYVNSWGITGSGITISWSTDAPSTTALAYGVTSALGQITTVQTALTNSHGVTLTGLAGGTTYYFVAQATDAKGNTGYSTIYSFTTNDTTAPVIANVAAAPIGSSSAAVTWQTSKPAISWVSFGTTTNYNRWSSGTGLTTTPQPAMGYVPSGLIHYQVHSVDAAGHQSDSPDYTFIQP